MRRANFQANWWEASRRGAFRLPASECLRGPRQAVLKAAMRRAWIPSLTGRTVVAPRWFRKRVLHITNQALDRMSPSVIDVRKQSAGDIFPLLMFEAACAPPKTSCRHNYPHGQSPGRRRKRIPPRPNSEPLNGRIFFSSGRAPHDSTDADGVARASSTWWPRRLALSTAEDQARLGDMEAKNCFLRPECPAQLSAWLSLHGLPPMR